ncbi:protein kinase [Streptosporangiaceae bacterium NEAU-GS5]|nr:protein kinase [Streptosporangiaceae bacterium NEAU-GS5]
MSHPPPTDLDPGRQAPVPPPTVLDPGRDPGQDGRPPPTTIDPGREVPPAGDDWGHGRLPHALAERFNLVRELEGGAEAQLFLVTDHEGRERVIKLYLVGQRPDPAVSAAMAEMARERHLVEVFERGTAAGRDYEVMEHLAGGSLRTLLLGDPPHGLPAGQIELILRQAASALNALHDLGIPHRDIKPDNLLLRSREPLELAVIDFGISRKTDGTEIRRSRHGTLIYMAPEQLLGQHLSPAVDWWALGMTLLELSVGQHPFHHIDNEAVLRLQYALRDIDFMGVADERTRLLLRGLLTKDPEDRWGRDQVDAWLAGQSPDVHAPAPEETQYEPYDYQGRAVTGRIQLALLLAEEWDGAAPYYFSGTGVNPPWEGLRAWMARLDGDPTELFALADSALPPDVKLLRLVRWLHPAMPAVYRNEVLSLDQLTELARRALGPAPGTAPEVIGQLWDHRLLPGLAGAPLGAGLAEADARWRAAYRSWQEATARISADFPDLAEPLSGIDPRRVLPHLLMLATSHDATDRALRAATDDIRRELPHQVDWFTELTGPRSGTYDRLCALFLEAVARTEAADLHAARRRRAWLLQEEAVHLWYRNEDRPLALGWAAAGCCLVAAFWVWLIVVSDLIPIASTAAVDLGWICAILAIVAVIGVELAFAAGVGGPYHPAYSLIGGVVRLARAVAEPVRTNGYLGIAIVAGGAVAILAATAFLPPALPVGTVVFQVIWTVHRQRRWTADEAEREEQLAQARRERLEPEGGQRT